MNLNRYGVNLDEGLPLVIPEDFEQLYVDCFGDNKKVLVDWIQNGYQPLMLGGQVGSGKSTLINKAFAETKSMPDITLHFDQEMVNLDDGDFWGITLAGFINASLQLSIDLSFCILPEEIGGYEAGDWKKLTQDLCPQEYTLDAFTRKVVLRNKVAELARSGYLERVLKQIGCLLQEALKRPLFIFAAGLDKFEVDSAAQIAVQEIISSLSAYKTLFEVNAVHLFMQYPRLALLDRSFITTVSDDAIVDMMKKRLGGYAKGQQKQLEILAHWAGGNPRQALRLLTHYLAAKRQGSRSTAECIAVAIRNTTGDFFSFAPQPSRELMRVIEKSEKIASALFSLPGDKETARRALYGNWIFVSGVGNGTEWQAGVNPLVKPAYDLSDFVKTPELYLLKAYAEQRGMSAQGLGLSLIDEQTGEEKTGDQLLWETIIFGVESPVHTNIGELLNILSAALLSRERADRTILAYKDGAFLGAVQAYLFAKANTYEYQQCAHYQLEGGDGKQPIADLEAILSSNIDVISIEFTGKWTSHQLQTLDKLRDKLLQHQLLWWIKLDSLKEYLPHWTQLRQLFEVFILEDELLASISVEEVEADLSFFTDLVEAEPSAEANVGSNLKIVLEYLQKIRGGS